MTKPAALASISWKSAVTSTAGRSASSQSASAATTRRAVAALEPRFAACIAWGAIWDYHAVWKRRIEAQFKASLSVPGHYIMWILGAATLEDALKRLEPFKLDGVVQKMRCSFLVVHGEDDEQIPLSDAQALYDACGSKDKTLRVFTSEEGGAQHCQRDYLTLGCATMWSCFEDKLLRA